MNKNKGGIAYLSGTAYTGDKFKVLLRVHETFRTN